ncbi:MAG: PIG-L family deacetylase [Acidobacteriaceae bacterium]|nr:PIG-L family deacetylase [Acidobacteriaceae bacterium]
MRFHIIRTTSIAAVAVAVALAVAGFAAGHSDGLEENAAQREYATLPSNAMPIDLDRGGAGLSRQLSMLRTRASLLMITAHPDDEDGGMLAAESRGLGARCSLMSLNRGEGGQNAMTMDLYDALGIMRTQELLTADRYYGVDQYWGTVIDYGFSKTREEALEKWGYDRVLSDVVRVVRMTRPLVITSVFVGAPTDGHGNHQVAGQMAQEAYLAAGDPNRFPEQIRQGLRPWQPLKVYARVPFFAPTKEGTIYDYATDKYVPIRFYDYVNKTWTSKTPATTVTIAEGKADPAAGLTYAQIGRYGWGHQKSQNGGGTIPQPALYSAPYHRYGSRVEAGEHEESFFDGIDISLMGIVSLAHGDTAFLKRGLEEINRKVEDASERYRPGSPASVAPALADGLKAVRSLMREVRASNLDEAGKSDVEFEMGVKEKQFENALAMALQLSFDAVVAPEKEPAGPFAAFGGAISTFAVATPGEAFKVDTHLLNQGQDAIGIEDVEVRSTDGKDWKIKSEHAAEPSLAAGKELRLNFSLSTPRDPVFTKPYYTRPNDEQPYYDLTEDQYRNLSTMPYPLFATARFTYRDASFDIRKIVQTNQRVEGIGIQENPLLVGPPISVSISPAAGAVPVTAASFTFTCNLRSYVKGPANGVLKLRLPVGWKSTPPEHPFSFTREGDADTVTFEVTPHGMKTGRYEIHADAEYNGNTYHEEYRLVGYAGLRPYPYCRAASYHAVGVDVKTAAGLHVAFFPGTGDDVPRALQDLGVPVQILATGDLESGELSQYDAIVLGVRAYAVRPELREANNRLLTYVKNGGVLLVQYNLQSFDRDYGPYPFTLGQNPQKVVDEHSVVRFLEPESPVFTWPNKITEADFEGWDEERGHGFMDTWDPRYQPLVETHDPDQKPQRGGLLLAHYGQGIYIYDAFALYRQLPEGVPGAYRILANLISLRKNPAASRASVTSQLPAAK